MKSNGKLASKIKSGDFIITAEYLPRAEANTASIESSISSLNKGPVAVNVADNHYGIAMSSLAASVALIKSGIEPVFQLVTRDRNRIALQSDLMGAASLGIKNVLCLSGYHQTLIGSPQAANVFDIDSIQLVAMIKKMNDDGSLLDGTKFAGEFAMLIGAASNPFMKPMDLNILRLNKKIEAGADFIQTQAVFDVEAFRRWLETAHNDGITKKVAILAGVMPLSGYDEAKKLADTHTDFYIPDEVLKRLQNAGGAEEQKTEGINICVDIIKSIKGMSGLRGVHILAGGNETAVPQIISKAAL